MKEKLQKNLATGITAFLVIAASITLFFLMFKAPALLRGIKQFFRIIEPFIVGLAIAFILSPVYNLILRNLSALLQKKLKKKAANYISVAVALIAVLLGLLLVIFGVVNLVVPRFITSILGIINSLETYSNNFSIWLQDLLHNNPEMMEHITSLYQSISSSVLTWINSKFTPDAESLLNSLGNVSTIFSGVVVGVKLVVRIFKDIIIGLIVAAYFLVSKRHMIAQAKKIGYGIFNVHIFNYILGECRYIQEVFGGFIRGKLLDSLIIGVLCFVGCALFQFPYPIVIGVIVGVTNIIPFFGPFIGAVPCGVLILLVSPIKCLYFVIFILVLQQFDGNVLGPRILGNTTGLSSFWVLFSILLFGSVFGFVGMVIGVPLFAVIYSLIDTFINHRLKKKELPVSTTYYELLDHVEESSKDFVRNNDPTVR